MLSAVDQPISPELVLVSPDLRGAALARLPTLDPDALFVVTPSRPAATRPERREQLPLAITVYAAEAVLLGTLRGVGMFLAIALAALLLAW